MIEKILSIGSISLLQKNTLYFCDCSHISSVKRLYSFFTSFCIGWN